ncbi:MAG TPA: BrnT family toxin [Sedimentisphaerales bacterium]|nr:BrnT family toxin [Sedimentisphaerales bacterium]
MIEFEWNPEKAEANLRKHGVGFAEAATVLRDPLGITIFDPDHSKAEDRLITIGMSNRSRALLVAHTDRGDTTRIISVRELTQLRSKKRKPSRQG